jgi:hypothetical protein
MGPSRVIKQRLSPSFKNSNRNESGNLTIYDQDKKYCPVGSADKTALTLEIG